METNVISKCMCLCNLRIELLITLHLPIVANNCINEEEEAEEEASRNHQNIAKILTSIHFDVGFYSISGSC